MIIEALHRGGPPQFSSKLFVSPETWSQGTSWTHLMTYLHTTHNTHTITHTWPIYPNEKCRQVNRPASDDVQRWVEAKRKQASGIKMCWHVSNCVKMCQGGSHMYSGFARWPVHCHSYDVMKSRDSMLSLSRKYGSAAAGSVAASAAVHQAKNCSDGQLLMLFSVFWKNHFQKYG